MSGAVSETAVGWLRPLVRNKGWDYCIIWKLGNDRSRFMEWEACCCSGGNSAEGIETMYSSDMSGGGGKQLMPLCKDNCSSHLVTSKACKALAQLPSCLPLNYGIHGDAVMSKQPEWVISASDNQQTAGTRVLIPVACGLIELYSEKHVPKNQNILDYIAMQFNLTAKHCDIMSDPVYANLSFTEQLWDPYSYNYIENWLVPPVSQTSLEGSSTSSCLSSERGQDDHVLGIMKRRRTSCEELPKLNELESRCNKARKRAKNGPPYNSKNLLTERNRRKRIKDGIFALRALVPNISKMNRIATLGDAANYIEELLETIHRYNEEIQALEVEHHAKINNAGEDENNVPMVDCMEAQSGANENEPIEVEVSPVGTKDFLLKLVSRRSRGGFSRLMEAMDSLGLQVTHANVTSFNGSVSNVLKVEANRPGTGIETKTLKNSLMQLVRQTRNEAASIN